MTLQYHLPLPSKETWEAEDFFISDANRAAARWAFETALTDWPSPALILFGAEGVGKTHLLKCWAARVGARQISLGDQSVEAIVAGTLAQPLALDDADGAAGDPAAEEGLQHLYNAAAAAHCPLLMTARQPPKNWGLGLADILSRLSSCAAVALDDPDDALLRAMLVKQFSDRQLFVEDGVIEYLARRLDRTGAAIRYAVEALDSAALEQRRKISTVLAQKLFGATEGEPC